MKFFRNWFVIKRKPRFLAKNLGNKNCGPIQGLLKEGRKWCRANRYVGTFMMGKYIVHRQSPTLLPIKFSVDIFKLKMVQGKISTLITEQHSSCSESQI